MMIRLAVLILALAVGCSGDLANGFSMKRVGVNGAEITLQDGAQTVNHFSGCWESADYGVFVRKRKTSMNGILQTTRVSWPDCDFYTIKPKSWPSGTSIKGVLRGPKLGVSHAQFQIQSRAGLVFVEFFAETNSMDASFFESFFGESTISTDGYRFPEEGRGHVKTTPLYPSADELP